MFTLAWPLLWVPGPQSLWDPLRSYVECESELNTSGTKEGHWSPGYHFPLVKSCHGMLTPLHVQITLMLILGGFSQAYQARVRKPWDRKLKLYGITEGGSYLHKDGCHRNTRVKCGPGGYEKAYERCLHTCQQALQRQDFSSFSLSRTGLIFNCQLLMSIIMEFSM